MYYNNLNVELNDVNRTNLSQLVKLLNAEDSDEISFEKCTDLIHTLVSYALYCDIKLNNDVTVIDTLFPRNVNNNTYTHIIKPIMENYNKGSTIFRGQRVSSPVIIVIVNKTKFECDFSKDIYFNLKSRCIDPHKNKVIFLTV